MFEHPSKRAYRRCPCQEDILYARYLTDAFSMGTALNTSLDGMYFETPKPVPMAADIDIKREAADKTAKAGEDLRRGRVRWCRPIPAAGRFGIGVQYMPAVAAYPCDYCGETTPYPRIRKIDTFMYLCDDCCDALTGMSPETMRSLLKRFILGNVI
jgi:hypothetical protein